MSYTKAQIAAIGKELATASGGLIPAPVGAAWASAEQGINNNVFGLGASHAGVPAYSSTTAAVQATWHQMTSSGVYAATISRLQAAGGNVGKAALAIAESPWHLGAAGVKAAGGVDPYYARVFTQAGIPVSTAPGGSSGGGTWTPAASGSSGGGSFGTMLSDLFTTSAPGSKFNQTQLGFLVGDIPVDNPNRAKLIAAYTAAVGQPLNTISKVTGTFTTTSGGMQSGTAWIPTDFVSGLSAFIVKTGAGAVVLLGLLALGYVGVRKTLG